jgi:SAM-dependent methyltransferase
MSLSADLVAQLICPRCKSDVRVGEHTVVCTNVVCGSTYPFVRGVPILIDENESVFLLEEFVNESATTFDWDRLANRTRGSLVARVGHFVADRAPTFSLFVGELGAAQAIASVCAECPEARILVIGCGDQAYDVRAPAQILYSDVSLGPITEIVFDANNIPFKDETFDAVITVAVLCCATDPQRCVGGIRRVLKPQGCVYDTMPFMQQVFLGRYDFTRFTYLGHRRLFRGFGELKSGVASGPAMATCWSLSYLVASFSENLAMRKILRLVSRYLFFWIKYLDRLVARRAGAYDCASGFYFFGRKAAVELTDREIMKLHRGLNPR